MNATRQEVLNERYADYIDNPGDLGANEIYQLGFRLGRRLGHRQLHAVDARGRSFFADMTDEEYEAAVADLLKNVPPERIAAEEQWDQRFSEMYTWEDELIDRQTLAEHLVFSNDPAILRRHHGHYLVGEIKLGRGDNYLGADLKTRWYNRNLRIFSNIQRIIDRPNDRVVVIIGSGHVPILRHAFLASPEYALVEVRDVL